MNIPLIGGVVDAASKAYQSRVERKRAQDSARAKLELSRQDADTQVTFNDQELERINTALKGNTWADEYATVSVLSILNLYVVGGILAAFGRPEVLSGIALAMDSLTGAGIEMGLIVEAVVFAAIGLTVWRKV